MLPDWYSQLVSGFLKVLITEVSQKLNPISIARHALHGILGLVFM